MLVSCCCIDLLCLLAMKCYVPFQVHTMIATKCHFGSIGENGLNTADEVSVSPLGELVGEELFPLGNITGVFGCPSCGQPYLFKRPKFSNARMNLYWLCLSLFVYTIITL